MSVSSRFSTLTPCRSPTPEPPIVQPDHFYGSEGIQLPPSPSSDGKTWLDPNDDLSASRGIPVFKPTMEEFKDFEGYMEKIDCWGKRSGIVKVIPPKEWTGSLPSIKPQLSEVKIKTPIEQHMLGSGGLYRQQNMEKRKIMSVREWVDLCNKEEYRAPGVQEVGLEGRGANTRNAKPRGRKGRKKETVVPDNSGPDVVIKEEPVDDYHPFSSTSHPPAVPSPPNSDGDPRPLSRSKSSSKSSASKEPDTAKSKPKGRRAAQTREVREANLADRAARDRDFVETFEPHKDWLPPHTKATDYTPEVCQKLERHYWRNCSLGKPAWYGADTMGTLYTDETSVWNVGHLPSALSRLLPSSDRGLPGVNTPYLYFGMWRATFAWHVEDMDLYSINYIHFGAPKFWYAVPQAKANALEHAMRTYFPKDTSQCPQFLRHKSFLASPTTLAQSSCRPNHLVQQAGEFVITYPRGYHAGFNLGLNCAESVNFALDSWLAIGRVAKACECVPDSVRIDVDQLIRDREEEVNRALEPPKAPKSKRTPKKTESIKKEVVKQEFVEGVIPPLKISRKRKADGKDDAPRSKKIKLKTSKAVASSSTSATQTSVTLSVPKFSVTLKLGPRPAEPEPYPCCLCVSMSKEGLLRVHDPPIGRKDAVDAANNPKVWMAHENCASVVPETWVDEITSESGAQEKVVFGVDGIVKDRWNLKCSACTKARPKVHGAPVQCTKGKCPKAFHVTCAMEGLSQGIVFTVVRDVEKEVVLLEPAASSNVHSTSDPSQMQIDSQPPERISSIGGNGQPSEGTVLKVIRKLEVQILCTQHNPAIAAQKRASKQDKIKNDLLALPSMARVKIRVSAGVFEVSLIRVIEETSSVEVLWDRGIKREFKWGSVVFGSTEGPVQQKPSQLVVQSELESSVSIASPTNVMPVPTYPSVSAATGSVVPGPVKPPHSLPAVDSANQSNPTNSHGTTPYMYPPRGNPYDHWPYSAHMQYSMAQPQYVYAYNGYYPNPAVAGPSQNYNPFAYAQSYANLTQYRGGQLQWQQPYQGPQGSSLQGYYGTTLDSSMTQQQGTPSNHMSQPVSQPPTSAQAQPRSSDKSSDTPANLPNPNSSFSSAQTYNPCAVMSPQSATQPTGNPPPALNAFSGLDPAAYRDLAALALLPPAQVTEILSGNPQLRDIVLAALDQANRNAAAAMTAAA